jgi:tetratricopeptide (TPR) repeat protein
MLSTTSPTRFFANILSVVFLFPLLLGAQANPNSFEDVVARASSAREQGDAHRALELYRQALQLNPQWPDGWWYLGALQYGDGAYPVARDALSRYIELTPDAGPALAMRGLCEFETGEYSQSLKDIQRGLSFGAANAPRNEKILRYHEGLLLTRSGRFEDALHSFGPLARDEEANSQLPLAVGLAGLRVPLLPKDVKTDQREMFSLAGTATLHFMAGDESRGRQEFQDLFQHFPSEANEHYLYGYLLFAVSPDEAVKEFKRELEIHSNAAADVMLAWVSLLENDPAGALPYARQASERDPGVPGVQLVLGRSLAETGEVKTGIEHLEKALQFDPENLEVHLALATAYAQSGRKEDARRERLRSLQLTERSTKPSVAHP